MIVPFPQSEPFLGGIYKRVRIRDHNSDSWDFNFFYIYIFNRSWVKQFGLIKDLHFFLTTKKKTNFQCGDNVWSMINHYNVD